MASVQSLNISRVKRFLQLTRGRPLAVLTLLFIIFVESINSLPLSWRHSLPGWLSSSVGFVRTPMVSAENWLFDSYQQAFPREVLSQPLTIIAVDEKSLSEMGQWPWPRDRLADLIATINVYGPLAIGLDMYMPEPDQGSPDKLAERIASSDKELLEKLSYLPSHDTRLANAMLQAPVILGAAGFEFQTYTTSDTMLTVPVQSTGEDALPFVKFYPQVLASLRQLQEAALGQAILSVQSGAGPVRKIPLLANVAGKLVPAMSLEILRVATGSDAVYTEAGQSGIESVSVADLTVRTQPEGDIYLHYAPLQTGFNRYVSATDVLNGDFDPLLLENKLVIIGLTGTGLNDVRHTALDEQVPGVEIQAQVIEAMFDGSLLHRPLWLPWLELILVAIVGALLIWHVPRSDSRLGYLLKRRPVRVLLVMLGLVVFFSVIGIYLFHYHQLLFSVTGVGIGIALLMGLFFVRVTLENLAEARLRMRRLVDNGIALGRKHNQDELLSMTLDGAMSFAPCEAVVIFLKTEDQLVLPVKQTGLEVDWTETLSLPDRSGEPNLLQDVMNDSRTVMLEDGELEQWQEDKRLSLKTTSGRAVHSLLALPMLLANGKSRGLVLMINAVDPATGIVGNFSQKILPFVDALATQTAVAVENSDLLMAQRNMMDAMIQMIAGAIDAKSPYTGGHCERVPELATMLCEAASESNEDTLADFAFTSDDEWREFKIAAWLHDCGKVTTPEHVVDKATKLETIYNRIHEVRMRFEVLLRDAQINFYEAVYERGEDRQAALDELEQSKAALYEEFAFIADCNVGGEFLAPEKIDRIMQIAGRTWTRNFDDRAGLSDVELLRYTTDPVPLPATEQLLSDRPEHVIPRPPSKALDPKFGFKLDIPENLYNLGELHNLRVSRGTLTAEDRFKINEHIVQTIAILEQMPFPPNLRRVPEYAGSHHETLIGTGYPRKLTGDDLSIPARIMAIADIFEALTASDRPYKKAKTLSESIKILSFFKKDQHIDPVLFDLFLTSGIYKTYAERFLLPEQVDEVDISQYLG